MRSNLLLLEKYLHLKFIMISHRTIALLIEDLGKDVNTHPDSASKIVNFLDKYKLQSLLAKSLKVLDLKRSQKENFETLIIRVRSKTDLDDTSINKVRKILSVPDVARLHMIVDPNIGAGFLAFYKGKMFDGRIETLAQKLSEKLKENIEN